MLAPETAAPDLLAGADPLAGADESAVTGSSISTTDAEQPGPRPRRKRIPPPVQGATFVASQRDPARWAKVMDVAGRLHIQPDFVDRNFDALSHADQQQQSRQQLAGLSPTFASWMSNPDNATLAQHEIEPLARIDRGAKIVAPTPPDGGGVLSDVGTATATGMADLGSAAGQLAVAWGLASPQQAAKFVADMNTRAQFLREQAPDYTREFSAAMDAHAGDVDKAFQAFTSDQGGARRGGILAALGRFAAGASTGQVNPDDVEGYATLGETLAMIGAAARRPRGLAYQGVESLASMAPMMGGAAAGGATGAAIGSALGPVGTVVGGIGGGMVGTFAGAAPVNIGSEINAELTRRKINTTDPAALERAFSDPALMSAIRAKAERAGATNAMVMALFSGFAGQLSGVAERAGAGTVGKIAAKSADVAVQAGGMGAAQAAGEAAGGEPVSAGHALSTAISMLGVGAAMEGIGASRRAAFHADPVEAAAQATTHADDALRAHRDAQALSEIGDAVKEATTTAQVPDRIKSLIETATGGQDAATVYFQGDDWNKYWTSKGASPARAAADIMGDDGRAYYEAQTTGARLAVPLGDYVSKVAPTEHWDGLLNVARTRPDGMSLGEASDYLASLPATMKAIADEAAPRASEPGDSAKQIGADVEAQLTKAGVGGAAAKAQATLVESTFRTMGARVGVDPLELFNRYNLAIGRGRANDRIARAAEAKAAADAVGAGVPDLADEGWDETPSNVLRARTDSGRLKSLRTVTDEELGNEYRILIDANANENTAPSLIPDENFHTFSDGRAYFGMRTAAAHALGRVAARAKSIAKVEAELTARGIEHSAAYFKSSQDAQNLEPGAFSFEQSPTGGAPRGRIIFGEKGVNIDLLQKADRSTFLHETGHFYLKLLDDLARSGGAPEDVKADHATIRDWLGAKDGEELTREHHEQFARGFEAYLMEGKAPTTELRGVFYRFKTWLVGVYKQLGALNVSLTPEVRRVFDRMLASDDAIKQAESDQHVAPLFPDAKAAGMTDAQAATYRAAVLEARQSAEEDLTARLMHEVRREETAQWKAWRDPIRADVEREVNEQPIYKALEYLRKGTNPDGSALPEGTQQLKLSRAETDTVIGKDAARALPRDLFGKDGVHPDVVAEMFGFGTGRELLDALQKTPSRKRAIDSITDDRVRAEHGERMTDADVYDKATQALHGEKRAQLLRKELEHLASENLPALKGLVRAVAKKIPPSDVIRAQAAEIVGAKAVREIRPDLFEKAAERHAVDAREALLRGDVDAAFEAKRKELLATEVYRAAADAKQSVETALDEFRKVFRRDERLADTRDLDLVNAARAVLASFGIGRTDKPASAYLEQMRNYDPEMYETVRGLVDDATANAGDHKSLSYDDFSAMREAVSSLWELSRRTRQIEIDGKRLDRQAVEAELSTSIAALKATPSKAGYDAAVTRWEKSKRTLMSGRAWLRRTEHWADAMDKGDPAGAFRRYVWRPISEAATRYRVAKRSALEEYLKIVKPVEESMKGGAIPAPELGYTFRDKAELVGAMLHTGNESNLSKLLRGRHWGEATETGTLDTTRWDAFVRRMQTEGKLSKADYDYLQGVWDLLERQKPDAQRAHRDMFGHYFAEVTSQSFTTPFGDYRGGYFPAKADPFMVPDQALHRERETLLGNDNSFMFPTTGRGFTKSRVEAYAKPLIIDAAYVPSAIDAVLRFTHLEPHVRDVARVVTSRGFRPTLDAFDPTVGSDMLVPWLQRAAQQRIDVPGKFKALDTFWREMRTRSGLQIMAASVTTAVQMIGHAPGALVKMGPGDFGGALWRYMRSPREFAEDIASKSSFMATRETAAVAEIEKTIDHLMLNPSTYEQARQFTREHGYFLTHAVQNVIDHVVWGGAYDDAIGKGVDETEAIRRADSVVRETQGSFAPEDLSRFETNTPFLRSLSMFYSFFNTKANLLGTEFANTTRTLGLRKGAGKLLYVYTTGFMIPALMWGVTRQLAGGKPFYEDDDGPIDPVLRLFFGSQLHMASSMIPIAGAVVPSIVDTFHGKEPDELMGSPAVKAIEATVRAPHDVYQAIHDRMVTSRQLKDVLTLIGLMTGLPIAPLAKPVGYINDVNQGKANPTGAYDVGRGLLTGQAGGR